MVICYCHLSLSNDLPEIITSGDLFMFADDTTIFTIRKNIDDIILTLQSVLDQVHTWCKCKSEALIISNQNFPGPLPCLTYGNSTIEYKLSSKCPGLTINNKLSWQEHIKNVCKSLSKKVALLKRIKFLPKPILETIYCKTIIQRGSVCYCSLPVLFFSLDGWYWSSSFKSNQNYSQFTWNIHNDDIMNAPYWNCINSFYIRRLLVITYK